MGLPGAPRFGPAEMAPEKKRESKRPKHKWCYILKHTCRVIESKIRSLTVVPCLLRPGSIGEELPERFSMELGCVHCDRRD